MLVAVTAPLAGISVVSEQPIATDHAAQITTSVIVILDHGLCERAGSGKFVQCCEMRSVWAALLRTGHELPTELAEKTMIAAGHKRRAVLQSCSKRRLDDAPVREDAGFHVAPIRSDAARAVDLIAHAQLGDRARTSVTYENGRIRVAAITASMSASPVGIDRALERNIWRIIGRDHFARAIRLESRGNAVGHLILVPAVIDGSICCLSKRPGGLERAPRPLKA